MLTTTFLRSAGRLAPLLLATALLTAGAAGCDRREEPARPDGQAAQAAETPRRGGTIVTGWISEPNGVNEFIVPSNQPTNELLHQIFLQLVDERPDFEQHPPTFAPELARSYEFSPDHKTLTFHLRDDVLWSDGVPVTAEDVRFTWQAQTHPDVAWDNAFMKESITDAEVVDPHTVRFHFSHAYARQMLDVNEGMIIPKHAWEKLPFAQWRQSREWFKENLVVSGPFTVASWQPQQQVVLQRNERYFKKDRPLLDRVVMRVIPEQSTLMAELNSGQVDFVAQVGPGDAPSIRANPRLQLYAYWFSRLTVGVAWNLTREPFSDPEVRRALTLAIDRQSIADTLWGELGRVASSPISTGFWGHDRSLRPWPYDPEQAKRILAARGWKDSDGDGILDRNGKRFSFEILSNAGNQQRIDAGVMIQEQLKRIGIQVVPRVVEFNTMLEQADAGRFDAVTSGMTVDTGLDLTSYFHSRSVPPEGINFMRYSNPEVDRLIEQSLKVMEPQAAKPALDRIQQILHQDQPVTFLWESQRLSAASQRLRDAEPNVLRTLYNVEDWWVREP
ncbi:MAG TPA: ABC transporter substrate-binding protein [Thermoanaerobaculia bacterium]|nr:ABC transporter substrate-binding protein [Thermoanaerobaculia bacterium]